MNQQKSKNFQCNNIFELLLINKNYLFFHNTHKIRRPHKANLDMAGKILTWRENSAASQSKRAWNAPWNAPSPPRIFSCRHDNVMTTRDNKGALSRISNSQNLYVWRRKPKKMGHFYKQLLHYNTETVNRYLWLWMAWMEMDCNLHRKIKAKLI